MPSSDQMFGIEQKTVRTMSTDQMPPGMFGEAYAAGKMTEPSSEEMELAAEAVRYSKVVKIKEFHVDTFDLSDPIDKARYKKEIVTVYNVMAEKRGVISYNEKKLIIHEGRPKMVVHLEWYEYTLKITDHMMKGKPDNGKKKRRAADVGHNRTGEAQGQTQGTGA